MLPSNRYAAQILTNSDVLPFSSRPCTGVGLEQAQKATAPLSTRAFLQPQAPLHRRRRRVGLRRDWGPSAAGRRAALRDCAPTQTRSCPGMSCPSWRRTACWRRSPRGSPRTGWARPRVCASCARRRRSAARRRCPAPRPAAESRRRLSPTGHDQHYGLRLMSGWRFHHRLRCGCAPSRRPAAAGRPSRRRRQR